MNQLITYIESLDPLFTHIQIANGYDWQNSIKLDLAELKSQDNPHLDLSAQTDVAIEFFFNFAEDHQFFIGFKYDPDQLKGLSAPEFVQKLLRLAAKTKGPEELLRKAGKALFDNPNMYLDRNIDRAVELVVNYWDEAGTAVIWKQGEKPLDRTGLQHKLAANRELTKTKKNSIAIEIDYGAPAMWIGIDVSRKVGHDFILQSDIVLAILQIAQQQSQCK
ncbi:MAG: hypothetical protein QG553_221 [Patescibacteria group bacterium]|nr:hypothetical protein [Patescibacteria group bacterium]